jgi:AraC-like DNA-binding protein
MIPSTIVNFLLIIAGIFITLSIWSFFRQRRAYFFKLPLVLWFFCLGIFLGSIYIVNNQLEYRFFHWLNLSEVFSVLPGMLLYHFFISLCNPFRLLRAYVKEYIPFFGLMLAYLMLGEFWLVTDFPHRFIQVFAVSVNFGYSVLLLIHLKIFRRVQGYFFSGEVDASLNWLRLTTFLLVGLLIVQTTGMFYQVFGGFIPQYGNLFANVFLCCLVSVSGFWGLRQKGIFHNKNDYEVFYTLKEVDNKLKGLLPVMQFPMLEKGIPEMFAGEEYNDTGYSDLRSFVAKHNLYRNPDINLTQLAFAFNVPAYKISRLLSKEGLNFYEFINQFRIEAVLSEFKLGKTKDFTIFSIAQGAGFKSKASFNRIFKQFLHITPSEFIDSLDK